MGAKAALEPVGASSTMPASSQTGAAAMEHPEVKSPRIATIFSSSANREASSAAWF